jgi:hypothetical protein
MLIAELNQAFSKNTWARRHETKGPETAWRRACHPPAAWDQGFAMT